MPGAHVKSNWPQVVRGGETDCFAGRDSSASRFWGIFTYFWRKDKLNSGASGRQREGGRWCGLELQTLLSWVDPQMMNAGFPELELHKATAEL